MAAFRVLLGHCRAFMPAPTAQLAKYLRAAVELVIVYELAQSRAQSAPRASGTSHERLKIVWHCHFYMGSANMAITACGIRADANHISGGGVAVEQPSTNEEQYTNRLATLETAWWKRLLNVQAPYAWNLRRLKPGRTLEIGCGIGRNLRHLRGQGVGIDHNPFSVRLCRAAGLEAYTLEDFPQSVSGREGRFDSLLFSHILEHMPAVDAEALVRTYLPQLRPGGQIIIIAPQERGYASDATHVQFVDFAQITTLAQKINCRVERRFSFPLPRIAGMLFTYNEFVAVLRRLP